MKTAKLILAIVVAINFNIANVSSVYGNIADPSGAPCTVPGDCNDGVACTDDVCDPILDCQFTANDAHCDDRVACTDDVCDPILDCQFTANDAHCDDGVSCTDDVCDAVLNCQFTANDSNCDDGVSCTDDVCDQTLDCQLTANNANCNDGDVCTSDLCQGGNCLFTVIPGCSDPCDTLVCADGDACTTDSCINGVCVFTALAPAPEVCIVSVDSASGKNIIIWEKPVTSAIDSYVIFKETNQTNVYAIIGTQAYSEFSAFVDQQSFPEQNSNKYKLGFINTCGQTIEGTTYHKTIHLTINQGVGNSWNLIWNHYEGFTFSTYNIYRGTTPGNLSLLNSIAGNNNSYTDLNPPAGNIYYQIEVINPNSCNPTARMGNYSASRSNIANTSSVGIGEPKGVSLLKMYPNPFSSSITIEMPEMADGSFELILFDVTGKQLLNQPNIAAPTFILQRNRLVQGIYYAELRGANNIYRGKIIAF